MVFVFQMLQASASSHRVVTTKATHTKVFVRTAHSNQAVPAGASLASPFLQLLHKACTARGMCICRAPPPMHTACSGSSSQSALGTVSTLEAGLQHAHNTSD
jgi:hypothetical protein